MRLLIASMAALAAVAFAAPSFAQQEEPMPAPTAKPAAKAKPGTAAYCNKLKSSSQRSACLKKIQVAKAQPAKKTRKPAATPAPKQPDLGQAPASAPAAAPAAAPTGPVAVPPLPSKTI
jgi:hypothetical protein